MATATRKRKQANPETTTAAPRKRKRANPETTAAASPDWRTIRRVADRLKQTADPTRLTILMLLAKGAQNVGAIGTVTGQSQPAISHHLALLRVGGIVECQRMGKQNVYSLTEAGQSLVKTSGVLFAEEMPAAPVRSADQEAKGEASDGRSDEDRAV